MVDNDLKRTYGRPAQPTFGHRHPRHTMARSVTLSYNLKVGVPSVRAQRAGVCAEIDVTVSAASLRRHIGFIRFHWASIDEACEQLQPDGNHNNRVLECVHLQTN
ncbi:uncharacterized protein LOC100573114 [Acyrthosiphon pisum]|uniref:Uncharacterized protein n=1 Tax=Acyrthosiphon pisum TaxID=7029 RepID=A0A8R2ADA5_ACYPI|nr:uncharacterized protein LOC100573114 [Acyrthosiphon pisum]|eukprot:XP_003247990.1 PREDICTED: uncharacterized protein LOC100573114 [Acyrthosiphon pisum]